MTPLERMRAVLDAEAAGIQSVIVTEEFERVARVIARGQGRVITTGMGKAGLIARKFAATLCSGGTPACFVHPGESAHGDLGAVVDGDVLVAFSTSGKTAEVLEMLAAVERLCPTVTRIGITSHVDAPLRAQCRYVLDMGVMDEPCPLGLTPSASTAVMLAISDAIALSVLELLGTTRQDFGARHRAGYLGAVAQ